MKRPSPNQMPLALDAHQPEPSPVYIRRAFYSGAPGGRVVCHRCRLMMAREQMAEHTAVCWPDAGTPRSN